MNDSPLPTFAELGVPRDLVRALAHRGITTPFPIQAAALPDALAGRDVLGSGRTGSGKTVAFALPVIARLAGGRRRPGRPRALVLVPTRELAVQVAETMEGLGRAAGVTTMTVFGGVRYAAQLRKLERGVDVVIATPGRLEDLLDQGALTLADVEVVVIDEADLMADMGFLPPVTRLLEQVPPGQRLLFSATLDGDVRVVVDRFLHDPLTHSVDPERANAGVTHRLFLVTHENKRAVLTELVTDAGRTLLFVRTKTFAERLATELTDAGVPAAALHGNLRQGARQKNLAAFAEGRVGVLVATDIAARGIHVDDIGLVVHVDPPLDPKAFLHRSGRTARAGAEGVVVTLATRNQNKAVKALMAQARIKPVQEVVEPGAPVIGEVRAPKLERRPSGPSLFTPNPDDVDVTDDPSGRGSRDERGRTPRRPSSGRPAAGRGARGGDRPLWREVPSDERRRRRADDFEDAWEPVGFADRGSRGRSAGERGYGQRRGEARPGRGRSDQPGRSWGRDDQPREGAWTRDDQQRRSWGRDDQRSTARGRDEQPRRERAWGRDAEPRRDQVWGAEEEQGGRRGVRRSGPQRAPHRATWNRDDRSGAPAASGRSRRGDDGRAAPGRTHNPKKVGKKAAVKKGPKKGPKKGGTKR